MGKRWLTYDGEDDNPFKKDPSVYILPSNVSSASISASFGLLPPNFYVQKHIVIIGLIGKRWLTYDGEDDNPFEKDPSGEPYHSPPEKI